MVPFRGARGVIVTESVTLHLDRSRTARPFKLGETLWGDELNQIWELLLRHSRVVSGSEDDPLLALALFGSYGSGKTSLLETLRKLVNDPGWVAGEDQDLLKPKEENRKRWIYSLPILRPNLVTRGESFLYAFLAAVLREERDLTKHEGRRKDVMEKPGGLFTAVERSLQEVTEHLQVLDETGESSSHDPIGASVAKLERHASDYKLKLALDDLIRYFTLSVLGDKDGLLLLPIDDTDLSRKSLFETLDSIRRYLEHPRLVPICTFNGRLAEELLVAHFSNELERQERSKGPEWHEFEAEIALQYLARMFPVRNRIRLGATTAKVQNADYEVQYKVNGRTESCKMSVRSLLEDGSKVLFGLPEPLVEPTIKLALRPVVLRRQLQILDALHHARVDTLLAAENDESNGDAAEPPSWAEVFDSSNWAVLDVHRGLLREVDIHLEDLYGWSPRSLREWILGKIVELERRRRSLLLDRWVHRTENTRGQVLSLLAVNVFRPEEGRGEKSVASATDTTVSGYALDASKVYTWFLNLWLGFYLPQILLRDREAKGETVSDMPTVGWHLEGAPALAMREAHRNRDLFGPGMMFLDHEKMAEYVEQKTKENADAQLARLQLVMNLWCFYGHEAGNPWCAFSLWRGLSLIGQLLRLGVQDALTKGEGEGPKTSLRWKIEHLLHRHLAAAHLPGSVRAEKESDEESDERAARRTTRGDLYILVPRDAGELEVNRVEEAPEESGDNGTGKGPGEKESAGERPSMPFPYYRRDPVTNPLKDDSAGEDPPPGYPAGTPKKLDDHLTLLAKDIEKWLHREHLYQTYKPLAPRPHGNEGKGISDSEKAGADPLLEKKMKWRSCLLRRLHGDEILGAWWPSLQGVYASPERFMKEATAGQGREESKGGKAKSKKQEETEAARESGKRERMNAWVVMQGWKHAWRRYWGEGTLVQELLEGCPLIDLPDQKSKGSYRDQLKALDASDEFPFDLPEHAAVEAEEPEKGSKDDNLGAGAGGEK